MDKVSILNIVNNIHHIDGNFKGCIYYISNDVEYNNPSDEFEVVTLSNIDEKTAFIAAIYDMIKHKHKFSLIINSSICQDLEQKNCATSCSRFLQTPTVVSYPSTRRSNSI